MNTEYEVKFLNINLDDIRDKLKNNGGVLESPMRSMKRIVIDTPELKELDAFLRVRDEGGKVTLTYKQFQGTGIDGAKELEVSVSDFDTTAAILKAVGLEYKSFQESRRETWKIGDTEIVIDEWPWLKPYIEIEGPGEEAVKTVAGALGLDWSDGVFGDVMAAYRDTYKNTPAGFSVGDVKEVKFDSPRPSQLS